MTNLIKSAALAAAASFGLLATAAPASAATGFDVTGASSATSLFGDDTYEYGRDRRYYRDRDYRDYRGGRRYNDEPVYRNTRTWRGRDGRYYCRRSNGTTGMIIGGAAGALLGRELDGGYNRATGTILGAAGGALLGRSVDRNNSRCR